MNRKCIQHFNESETTTKFCETRINHSETNVATKNKRLEQTKSEKNSINTKLFSHTRCEGVFVCGTHTKTYTYTHAYTDRHIN